MPETILHAGIASALGSLVHAAAAYRAGLSRARAIAGTTVDVEEGPEALVGHRAWPDCEPLDQAGQWVHLGRTALADLHAGGWRPTGTCAAVLLTPRLDRDRHGWWDADPAPHFDRAVLSPLLATAGIAPPSPLRRVHPLGHAGIAIALRSARELLESGADQVLLLAVDSYVDLGSPDWLAGTGRLKTSDGGAVIPGEAAVALVLAHQGDGPRVLAVAHEARAADADGAWPDEPPTARGRRWKAVFDRCRSAAGAALARSDAYVDLDGEAWRSAAWGDLLARTSDRWTATKLWTPVESFGETGAASGALAIALALRAWARGYARSDHAGVWSLAEQGDAALVVLAR